ncbi:MAG: nucleotide exchange factor GrpE [Cyanobacteria bacterium SZAS-4]|nr:nucleotide exchange factor GrpE [Cyanobacteria bacterium SZAS-4]
MATDDSGQNQNGDPGSAAPEPGPEKPEDRANRMNAAKAFYRAMYAGEEVAPDDFGMNDGSAPRPQAHTGPCPNCARLEAQAAEFEKQKNEAENYYKRIAADFENYRRRLDRERDEFQGLGIQKAIEQILPALDDMDRAKTSLQAVTDPKAILDSLNLVFARFAKCLEATGVKQMEVIGEPFDPRLHEPVQEIESNEYADGAVIHELRRGYLYKDKVLRPALVNVTSNPSGVIVKKDAPAPETAEAAPAPAAAKPAPAAETPAPAEAPAAEAPAPAPAPAAEASAVAAEAPAAAEPAPSPPEAQPEPPKKAIDKLKPTRPHTETQDLPVFKIDDFAESLAPEPDLETSNEPEPVKAHVEGTVYDISDVDVEDKPVGPEEPSGE